MSPLRTSRFHVFLSLAFVAGCLADDPTTDPDEAGPDGGAPTSLAAVTSEGFESGAKTSYAAADVSLASGTWTFADALIGTSSSDVKAGSAAARLRNSGQLTMQFDRTAGAGTVTISHATYGADASGTWALYESLDHGATWTAVGSPKTTATGALATAQFTANASGAVRFQIRKTDGASGRIDLDDIAITDYAGGGGSGGGSSGGSSGAAISVHTKLGLPAAASTTSTTAYLSVKSQYVVSYNSSRKTPNWVGWELNSTYLGTAPRSNDFRTDSTLPSGMAQATLADYTGSGYDRGHMCPSGDRTKTTTANSQTFYLSNMIPQAGNNNSGPWEKLETYERSLATSGKELVIVAGGIYGGTKTIGSGVAVPTKTFKVIVVLDSASQGAANVTTGTRVIGVVVPNDDAKVAQSDTWQQYRVSVRSIEAQTGYNFLSDVAPAIQDAVETSVDTQ